MLRASLEDEQSHSTSWEKAAMCSQCILRSILHENTTSELKLTFQQYRPCPFSCRKILREKYWKPFTKRTVHLITELLPDAVEVSGRKANRVLIVVDRLRLGLVWLIRRGIILFESLGFEK